MWSPSFYVAALLLLASSPDVVQAETLQLAECPEDFRNNGRNCERPAEVLGREVVEAECPADYEYSKGYCRKRYAKRIKPSCPSSDYQRFGDQCLKKCPSKEYRSNKKDCLLPRKTLGTRYMTCPEGQQRFDAYCCTPGENCPQISCQVGEDVPGTFLYDADRGVCRRQGESLTRAVLKREKGTNCEDQGLQQVWGNCQKPCPANFRATRGKCELFMCEFDPTTEKYLECPEGVYRASKSIF